MPQRNNQYSNNQTNLTTQGTILQSYNQAQQNSTQVSSNAAAGKQANASQSSAAQGNQAQSSGNSISVIGVFNSRDVAEKAVTELRQQGFNNEEINIISKDKNRDNNQETEFYDDDITDGTITGGTIGGIGGLILGAGVMAIPGIGPVLAAGPIAAALSGVVAGGLAGGLIDWGIPSEASHRYEQQVAQGGILAIIKTNQNKVDQAARILRQNNAADVETHAVNK